MKRQYSRLCQALHGFIGREGGERWDMGFNYTPGMSDQEIFAEMIDQELIDSADGLVIQPSSAPDPDYLEFDILKDGAVAFHMQVYKHA